MKALSFFLGISLLILISNCNKSPPKTEAEIKENERFQWATAGALTLRDSMRNPDSFRLESAQVMQTEKVVCYQYRSQNAFGGMARGHAVLTKDKLSISESDSGFTRIWNKECAKKAGDDQTRLVSRAMGMMR